MLAYDKSRLADRLGKLSERRRAIFAASCAQRLCPFYELYGTKTQRAGFESIQESLDILWRYLGGENITAEQLGELAERCESLVPDDDTPWHDTSPYASNAAAAVVYALETPLTETCQRPEWAAFQGYEAAWHYVDRRLDVDPNDRDALRTLDETEEVQTELARQEADLSELERETELSDAELAERLRARARANPPSYLEELRSLP